MSEKIILFAGLPEKRQTSVSSQHNEMLLMRMRGVPIQTSSETTEVDRMQNPNVVDPRDAEITSLRSTISDLLKVMEPFVRFRQEYMDSVPDAEKIDLAVTSLEVFTVGDLRALSEAFKRAKGT